MICEGCGEPIPDREEGTVWCDAPLGMTTLKTHRVTACARKAVEKQGPGWRIRKGNRPPLSKAERHGILKGKGKKAAEDVRRATERSTS